MNTITNAIRTECNEIYKSLHNIPYICKVVIGGSDLYIGEMKGNKRHGKGKYVYGDKDLYLAWNIRLFNEENGDIYEGEWKDDQKNGYGIYIHANGDVYEGEWRDGKRHGYGTYKRHGHDGFAMECEWYNGKPNTNTNILPILK